MSPSPSRLPALVLTSLLACGTPVSSDPTVESTPDATPDLVPVRGALTLHGQPLKAHRCEEAPQVLLRRRGEERSAALPLTVRCHPETRVLRIDGQAAPGDYEEVIFTGCAEGLPELNGDLLLLEKFKVRAPETTLDYDFLVEEFAMDDFAPEEISARAAG